MRTRVLIAAVLFAVWSAGLSYLVWNAALSHAAGRERDLMAKQLDKVLDEQAEDRRRAEKLQKTLDKLPRSQGVIREVVREHPSGCVLDPAVVDSLREAIRKANASRKVP